MIISKSCSIGGVVYEVEAEFKGIVPTPINGEKVDADQVYFTIKAYRLKDNRPLMNKARDFNFMCYVPAWQIETAKDKDAFLREERRVVIEGIWMQLGGVPEEAEYAVEALLG